MPVQDDRESPEEDGPLSAEDLITGAEVATYYKVDDGTVRKWRLNGRIPFIPKPGGRRYLYPRWLIQPGARRRDWWDRHGQQEQQQGQHDEPGSE